MSEKQPQEVYEAAYDNMSPRLHVRLKEQGADMTHSYLMMFGDPKSYAGFRQFAHALTTSGILWALAEGIVTLNDEWVISDEESAEREVNQASARVSQDDATVIPFNPGQYL